MDITFVKLDIRAIFAYNIPLIINLLLILSDILYGNIFFKALNMLINDPIVMKATMSGSITAISFGQSEQVITNMTVLYIPIQLNASSQPNRVFRDISS